MHATTLDRVKRMLPGMADDATEDAFLFDLIGSVSAAAEKWIRCGMEQKARTETFDVRGNRVRVQVAAAPVLASPAVDVRSDWNRAFDAATVIEPTWYGVDYERGMILFDRSIVTQGFQVLRIAYTGGIATNPSTLVVAAPDLVQAVTYQVVHEFRRRKSLDVNSESLGGVSVSVVGEVDWLKRVRDLMQPYRREGVMR